MPGLGRPNPASDVGIADDRPSVSTGPRPVAGRGHLVAVEPTVAPVVTAPNAQVEEGRVHLVRVHRAGGDLGGHRVVEARGTEALRYATQAFAADGRDRTSPIEGGEHKLRIDPIQRLRVAWVGAQAAAVRGRGTGVERRRPARVPTGRAADFDPGPRRSARGGLPETFEVRVPRVGIARLVHAQGSGRTCDGPDVAAATREERPTLPRVDTLVEIAKLEDERVIDRRIERIDGIRILGDVDHAPREWATDRQPMHASVVRAVNVGRSTGETTITGQGVDAIGVGRRDGELKDAPTAREGDVHPLPMGASIGAAVDVPVTRVVLTVARGVDHIRLTGRDRDALDVATPDHLVNCGTTIDGAEDSVLGAEKEERLIRGVKSRAAHMGGGQSGALPDDRPMSAPVMAAIGAREIAAGDQDASGPTAMRSNHPPPPGPKDCQAPPGEDWASNRARTQVLSMGIGSVRVMRADAHEHYTRPASPRAPACCRSQLGETRFVFGLGEAGPNAVCEVGGGQPQTGDGVAVPELEAPGLTWQQHDRTRGLRQGVEIC